MENNNESVINVNASQNEEEVCNCLICLKNDGEIYKYNHTCGRYWIHRHCAQDWFMEHPNECLICREPIFKDEEMRVINNEYRNIIRRPVQIVRENNINPVVYVPNHRPSYCPNDPCFNICVLISIIMLFYNLLVYLLK